MGFRFQKRVRLIPGVRLNFSKSGVSASFGIRGASVTVSDKGAHLNVGLPGSGLSYRTRIYNPGKARPSDEQPAPRPAPSLPEADFPRPGFRPDALVDGHTYTGRREFQSSHPDNLSSPRLRPLADLTSEVVARRAVIERAIKTCGERGAALERKLTWARLLRPLFTRKRLDDLAAIRPVLAETDAELKNIREGTVIDVDVDLDDEAGLKFKAVVEGFRAVAGSQKIWDIPTSYSVNRVATRSAAGEALNMHPVSLSIGALPELSSDFPTLRFGNVNGADLHLMPGMLALKRPGGGVALIGFDDLFFEIRPVGFHEMERLPTDAIQIGTAWLRANKDGSRDRRFASNREIPVMQYGNMEITSKTGLNERYMISNWRALEQLRTALHDYERALVKQRQEDDGGTLSFDEVPDLDLPPIPTLPQLSSLATLIRLLIILVPIGGGIFAYMTHPAELEALIHRFSPGTTITQTLPEPTLPELPAAKTSAAPVALPSPAPAAAPQPAPKPAAASEAKPKEPSTPPTLTAAEISRLQTKLRDMGYDIASVESRLGPSAVRAFNQWRSETGRKTVASIGKAEFDEFMRATSR